ncbi:MAG: hypothetical protein WC955_08650 [Elusimicrobiota bacterium]
MKKKVLFVFAVLTVVVCTNLFAEEMPDVKKPVVKENALTIGILQGASLIGADYERMINDRIGIQAGVGIGGFDVGVNYHLKGQIDSSFVSVTYWNQGGTTYDTLGERVLGLTYVYRRARGGLTAQIGFGGVLEYGAIGKKAAEMLGGTGTTPPTVIMLYSIGYYFMF